jgi:hypothetical protein
MFDRLSKLSESDLKEVPCKECGKPSKRRVSKANHKFAHASTQTRGAAPPSTGTSDDWDYDKVIGRDAEQKWKLIEERTAHKRKVLRDNPGSSGDDLQRTPDGDYRVMKQEQRTAIEEARAVGSAAIKAGTMGEGGDP